MKLLSPAGNFESLKVAVYNGADEVYLGINEYNARNNIDGFTLDNLKEAVDFAHLFGVRVFLALNILFSDDELQSALDIVVKANNLGVDAFIVQDLGLISLIAKHYPTVELHASTQMGIHNTEGVKALLPYGIKRVVLSRETPLSEIKRINANHNIETEYFVQGALCVSFSGNCYLSSYLFGASGNRGVCKQPCRQAYTLLKKGKEIKRGFLISAKDFNMLDKLEELKKANVTSLKIEGRARRPFYVATATREYRNALDGKSTDNQMLKLAFNREYVSGYFAGNSNIISPYSNHVGIFVGKVKKVNLGKNFNEIFISSTHDLHKKSVFKIFNNGIERTSFSAYDVQKVADGEYRVTTTKTVKQGDFVHLINDNAIEEQVLSLVKKLPIEISLDIASEKPIIATVNIDDKKIEIQGEVCQTALSRPLTEKDFYDSFNKSEYFIPTLSFSRFDKVFLTKSQINELRRKVYDKVFEVKTKNKNNLIEKVAISNTNKVNKFTDFEQVENIDDNFTAKNVIFSPETYNLGEIEKFIEKCQKVKAIPYLDTPNFATEKDIKILEEIISKTKIKIIANNYYALNFDTEKIIGSGLNVYNSYTAQTLEAPVMSAEKEVGTLYKFPYMTFRHCPIKEHLNGSCDNCKYSSDIEYKMENGKILKLKRKKLSSCTFYLTD